VYSGPEAATLARMPAIAVNERTVLIWQEVRQREVAERGFTPIRLRCFLIEFVK
jgi:hypothetical protein